ncbi:hypothetical protein R9C00_15920 [Flammeovirgaceae bacterium SG7u.111]|nr:hypothetical protein [Flammeovirgaceae bacterium SG7u.132]WPO33190.1 hypothetical protein R9C00_15920 [Flammeovirgaceae bacterium SG7u.111]
MNNITKKLALFSSLSLLTIGAGLAQDNKDWGEPSGSLEDARLLIEKETVLELPTRSRSYGKMNKIEREQSNQAQEYNLQLMDMYLGSITPKIEAMQVAPEPPEYIEGNYLKAGFGNYVSPYFEGFIGSERNNQYEYNARIKHFSSMQGPVDKENSAMSLNNIDLDGKYFLTDGQVNASLGIDRRMAHFYGYIPTPGQEINSDDIKQIYSIVKAGAGYESTSVTSTLDWGAGFNFYRLTDNFNASENNLDLHANGSYELSDESEVYANLNLILGSRTDTEKTNRNLYKFGGGYHFTTNGFQIKAGAKVAYAADTMLMNGSQFRIYPDVHASYNLIDRKLTAFAKLSGDLEQITLRSLIDENIFIGQDVTLTNQDTKLAFEGGISSHLTGNLGISAKVGYANVKNLPFFLNQQFNQQQFDVVYDEQSINILSVNADVSVEIQKFRGMFSTGFYNYGTPNLEEAWHRPNVVNRLSGSYQLDDKLYANLEFFHMGGIKAKDFTTDTTVDLDNIFDFNLRVDYVFYDKFSGFLAVNNVLSKNYERYLHYKSKGINALIGVTYSFSFLDF